MSRDHQQNKNQTIPTITTQHQAIDISHDFPNTSDDNDDDDDQVIPSPPDMFDIESTNETTTATITEIMTIFTR